jgi:hypothetical protein
MVLIYIILNSAILLESFACVYDYHFVSYDFNVLYCLFMQAVTATSTKKADLIFGEIQSQIKNKNITIDVKANSGSNVNLSLFFSLYVYLIP